MSGLLRNKWSHGQTEFVLPPLPAHLRGKEGLLPLDLVVDPQVGKEVALFLLDPTPFIHDLAALNPLTLQLKSGLYNTSYGPLLFLLFYVPDPIEPDRIFVGFDLHVNPFEVTHLEVWRQLARQTHWHLVLVGGDGQLVDFYEFENTYNLDRTLDYAVEATRGMPHGSFDMAKQEFISSVSVEDLFAA
jgi:hypothetical protein